MRRTILAGAAVGGALLLSLALIGCGRPHDDDQAGGTPNATDGAGKPSDLKAELKPLEGKAGAVLKGKVTIKGKPNIDVLTKELQTAILGKADQKATCFDMAPDAEKTEQKWVIDDKTGGVGNVVVWIQPPDGSFFKVDPANNGKWWPDKVELKQPHCAFIPHVSWTVPMLADPADPKKSIASGQLFLVSNSADVSHNTKWDPLSGASNAGELGTIKAHTDPQPVALKGNNSLVHFVCNIHGWMDAYVWVFNHPYAAVTDEHGNYEIKNVPAGSKVRITAWHEKGPNNGFLGQSKIKGDELELKEGETVKDFEWEFKEQ